MNSLSISSLQSLYIVNFICGYGNLRNNNSRSTLQDPEQSANLAPIVFTLDTNKGIHEYNLPLIIQNSGSSQSYLATCENEVTCQILVVHKHVL